MIRTSLRLPTLVAILIISGILRAQSYEDLLREAAALSAQGDYPEAKAKYEAALRLRADALEALSNLGVMHYMTKDHARALETMDRVLRLQPKLVPANLVRGLSLIQLNRAAEAVVPLEQVLAIDPKHRDALLGLASARVAMNDLEAAVDLYRKQTDNAPRDAEAWHGLAVCYERLAESLSRRLFQMKGRSAYHKRFLAEYLLQRGHDRLALEAATETAAIDPHQAGLDQLIELALRRIEGRDQGEWTPTQVDTIDLALQEETPFGLYLRARAFSQQSRTAFQRFSEIAPDSWQSHLFFGDLNRQQRNFSAAIKHYQTAARLQPESPAPLLGLGTIYWELADDEKAERYLREALKLNPKMTQALFELGNLLLKQRRNEEAAALLETCLQKDPNQLGARADLGKAYLRLRRYAQAVEQLSQARVIDTYGDIHYQLAEALKRLGRHDEAIVASQKSKQIRDRQRERAQRLKQGQ